MNKTLVGLLDRGNRRIASIQITAGSEYELMSSPISPMSRSSALEHAGNPNGAFNGTLFDEFVLTIF